MSSDARPAPVFQMLLLGAVCLVCAGTVGWLWRVPPGTSEIHGAAVLALLAVWSAAWAAGLIVARRGGGAVAMATMIGVAIGLRLLLLPATPLFSDDIWRYLWEGRVQCAGHSPYAFAPLHFAGTPFAEGDPFWAHINYPEISAIYPPIAQLIFLLVAMSWYGLMGMKGVMVIADLGVLVLLIALLRRRGVNPLWALAWGWSPLVGLEVAGSGHLDAIAAFFIVWWLFELEREREVSASIALGLAIATKLVPALLLPVALRWHRSRWTIALALLVPALLYIPYLDWDTIEEPPQGATLLQRAGLEGPTRALRSYGARWRHNDGGFFLACEAVILAAGAVDSDGSIASHETASREGMADHRENPGALRVAKVICYAFLLVGLSLIVWRARSPTSAALWTLGLWLILSPVVHPWYILLLLPLAILERRISWLVFSVTALFTYATVEHYLQTGEWRESVIAWAMEWGVLSALLVWELSARPRLPRVDRGADGGGLSQA
jgi:Glycosyltransferase family 87